MSKQAVMLSIRPERVEKILSGEKTIEVRKTRPKIDPPFKCYIYCTQNTLYNPSVDANYLISGGVYGSFRTARVVGEFVCDAIFPLSFYASDVSFYVQEPPFTVPGTCLTDQEIAGYLGNGKTGFGWHISGLKIYDEPKEIGSFYRWYDGSDDIRPCQNGKPCKYEIYDYSEDCTACAIDFDGTACPFLFVKCPPQSWCYVEEEDDD